ncbi:hypothetical protein D3C73_1162810 [compost metagenome]
MRTQWQQIRLHQTLVIGPGNVGIGLGQDHLQHIDAGAEERPLLTHLPQQFTFTPLQCLAQGRFPTQPGRQHQACLGPAEDPRNRPQAFDPPGPALGRPTAQGQTTEFLFRRGLAEILHELRIFPHHGAVSADTVCGQFVHQMAPLGRRWRRRQQGRLKHGGQVQVEVLLGDVRQAEFESNHFTLFGGAEPPRHRTRRLRQNRRVGRSAATPHGAAAAVEQ